MYGYITAVIYHSDGRLQLMHGPEDQVNNNLAMHEFSEDQDTHVRHLTGTGIADLVMIDDQRLPKTVAEFDARYPTSSAP